MTKDEFIQMQKLVTRRETRAILILPIIGFGAAVGIIIGGEVIFGSPAIEDFLVSLITVNRHLLIAGFGVLVLALALGFIAIMRNPGGVKCPKCGESVISTLALLTSNCGRCGERIIS